MEAQEQLNIGDRVRETGNWPSCWWNHMEGVVTGFRKRFPECVFIRSDDGREMEILREHLEKAPE